MDVVVDREDILRTFCIFHAQGDVVELRIPNAGRYRTVSGYFDESGPLVDSVVALADENFAGYYFTINPCNPDLLARSANRYQKYAKETTADADIIRRQWLPIDLDPVRPSGISSNEVEHAAALQKAKDTRKWLVSRGWPANAFILADSGNGGHLAVKIDLPNDVASRDLVKGCLEVLETTFSDDLVKVDTTTFNAARIWKIYGTAARKGSDTPDRPHRLARILEAPEAMQAVTREQLEALAAIQPNVKGQSSRSSQRGARVIDFDPVKYAEEHGATVVKTKSGWIDPKGKAWTLAILEECPFNADHNRGESWVGVADNGERGFGCPHEGCKDNGWQSLRTKWEPDLKPIYNKWIPAPDQTSAAGLAALLDTIKADPRSIKEPAYLTALADLKDSDPIEFDILLEGIKKAGIGVKIRTIMEMVEKALEEKTAATQEDDPLEESIEVSESAREIIESGKAYEFIYNIWQKRVKGNEYLGKALLVSRGVQSCRNTKGLHVYAHGKHGHGKSEGMEKMIELVPPEFRMDEDVSPLAIHYASRNDMLLPGTTILIDEMIWNDSLAGVIKRVITRFQKGAGHLTVIDGDTVLVRTKPRLAIWTNSADLQADEQLRDRFLDEPVDEGRDQVRTIIEFQKVRDTLPESGGEVALETAVCQAVLRDLAGKTFTVKIPFATRINIAASEGTRGYNILSDLVKGLAALRYSQREMDDQEQLLAMEEDFRDAKDIYEGSKGHSEESYTTAEKAVLQAIIDHGYKAQYKDIKNITGMSEGRIKDIVNGRGKDEQRRHGLRYKCAQLDVSTVDISTVISGTYSDRVTTHPVELSLPTTFKLVDGFRQTLVSLNPDVERRSPDVDPDVSSINNNNSIDVVEVANEVSGEEDTSKSSSPFLCGSIPSSQADSAKCYVTTSPSQPIAFKADVAGSEHYVDYVAVASDGDEGCDAVAADAEPQRASKCGHGFEAGMRKRVCLLCGERSPYDLGIHYLNGYICARCHREGPPAPSQSADSQTTLEASI